MDSIVLYTEEIDDTREAVAELLVQTWEFPLKKHSLALIFAEEETNFQEFRSILAEHWDFPIVGCTAMGMLGREGYYGIGVFVLLMTADDCFFAAGMARGMNADNYQAKIAETYQSLAATLPSPPKLILSYGSIFPPDQHVSGDDVVDAISEAAGRNIPIFGGLAADGFNFNGFRLLCNDEVEKYGQLIILIAGAVDPKFVTINSVETRANFSYEVTKSSHNEVSCLGNGTFLEALEHEDMAVDKTDVLGDYLLSPFILAINRDNGDSVEVVRNLSMLDHDKGSGIFLGAVPEGSILSVGLIGRADVQKSVWQAFDKIFDEIRKTKGKNKTLLCTSCGARFLALASDTREETDAYSGRLSEDMAFLGMYSYGEYCPVKGNKTGEYYNMFHNFTFTIMAI